MNEEIQKKAKFYLREFAEKTADQLLSSLNFVAEQKKILTGLGPNGDGWYQNLLQERIDAWEPKISKQKSKLEELDSIVKAL